MDWLVSTHKASRCLGISSIYSRTNSLKLHPTSKSTNIRISWNSGEGPAHQTSPSITRLITIKQFFPPLIWREVLGLLQENRINSLKVSKRLIGNLEKEFMKQYYRSTVRQVLSQWVDRKAIAIEFPLYFYWSNKTDHLAKNFFNSLSLIIQNEQPFPEQYAFWFWSTSKGFFLLNLAQQTVVNSISSLG